MRLGAKIPGQARAVILFVLALAACSGARDGGNGGSLTGTPVVPVVGLSKAASPPDNEAEGTATEIGPSLLPETTPMISETQPFPVPTLTPTAAPTAIRLTLDGCCAQPFWSPGGDQVLFIDKPSTDQPAGVWAVDESGQPPVLVTDRLGLYSPDFGLRAFPEGGETVIERLADDQRWVIPNEGRAVSFSPDSTQIAWTAGDDGPPFDSARREVWLSNSDGSEARQAVTVTGGGFSGWFPDGRLLISERPDPTLPEQTLWAVTPNDAGTPESRIELARGTRLRGALVSPGGTWMAYAVTFSEDPAQDGLWLVHTLTSERRRLNLFGAYRWRDDGRLLLVPLDLSKPTHHLWEIDAATGQERPLTDPAITPFKIANNDWAVSPDGRRIAFRSAEDYNIWILTLPL